MTVLTRPSESYVYVAVSAAMMFFLYLAMRLVVVLVCFVVAFE